MHFSPLLLLSLLTVSLAITTVSGKHQRWRNEDPFLKKQQREAYKAHAAFSFNSLFGKKTQAKTDPASDKVNQTKAEDNQVVAFFKSGVQFFQRNVSDFFQVTLAEGLNRNFVDKAVDYFEPELKSVVNLTCETVKGHVVKAVNETVDNKLDEAMARPWPGESIALIKSKIIHPLKVRAKDLLLTLWGKFLKILDFLVDKTEDFAVRDFKKALKRFFGFGKDRKHHPLTASAAEMKKEEEPVKVENKTGVYGFVQRKLDQLQSDIVGEVQPSMEKYVVGLRPSVMEFIADIVSSAVHTVIGWLGKNKVVRKVIDWLSEQLGRFLSFLVESQLLKYARELSRHLEGSIRNAFYKIFPFLRKKVAASMVKNAHNF